MADSCLCVFQSATQGGSGLGRPGWPFSSASLFAMDTFVPHSKFSRSQLVVHCHECKFQALGE
jgi:hypothetical protein